MNAHDDKPGDGTSCGGPGDQPYIDASGTLSVGLNLA